VEDAVHSLKEKGMVVVLKGRWRGFKRKFEKMRRNCEY
jgi:hypothetical protein